MKLSTAAAKFLTLASVASLLIATPTRAQVAQPSPSAPKPETPAQPGKADQDADSAMEKYKLDRFIVTATGDVGKVTELTSSFDVSVLDHKDIVTTTAAGPAGLLDSVPGFYGESSGGEVNQNVSVNGLRPSFYGYISLQEDGLPTMYNGFFSEFQIRPDSTYDRVEVVRNGPSAVFAPEGAAAIVNFISRMPSTDQGDATLSFTSAANKRIDFFYGGPIYETGWSGSVGGYFENGPGERPVGFDVTKGGQIRAALTKQFPGGLITITYKYINANTAFYLPMPAAENASGKLSALPGFDPHYDTLYSSELQNGTLRPPVGLGDTQPLNQIGNLDRTDQITVKFEKDIADGWRLSNNLRLAHIHYEDHDNRSGGNSAITSATSFLASSQAQLAAYALTLPGAPVVTGAQLVQVSNGAVIANPGALNGNGLLLQSDDFIYHANFDNIIDDLRATWTTEKNTLSLGLMYMDVSGTKLGETGNTLLIDVRNHAHAYDIVGLNAQGAVVDHLTDGGVLTYDDGGSGFYGNGNEIVKSTNYYLDDAFQITKELRIDGGIRVEQVSFSTLAEGWAFGAPLPLASANPTVIADQTGAVYGNGTYASGSSKASDSAWSVGANYKVSDHFALFARVTKDFDTGVQDFNVFGGQNGNPKSSSDFTTLRFEQLGARFENRQFAFSATAFAGQNDHVGETATLPNGQPTNIFIDYKSKGVDFEAVWKPVRAFELSVSGVLQRATLEGIPTGYVIASGIKNGNQIDRLPNVQIRVRPAYNFGRGSAYLLATYYGQRYGDLANTEQLGSYTNVGAGVSFSLTKAMSFDIVGDNLGNALAFTEGNPRGNSNLNAGGQAYVLARPIWGRNVKVSCTLHF
jgi:hypothetical protein